MFWPLVKQNKYMKAGSFRFRAGFQPSIFFWFFEKAKFCQIQNQTFL
tara:strand:- start:887 stop:1027 length:141 start_codon:yes stop_codon:yes gene_type:complete